MLTPQGKAQHWTEDNVYDALLQFMRKYDRAPVTKEWNTEGLPSHHVARRLFGSLPPLYARLGLGEADARPFRQQRWTAEAQIDAVARFHRRERHWPSTREFKARADLPHPVTVYRTFGTLAELRRRAGMPGGGHEGHGGPHRGGGWAFRKPRPVERGSGKG
jgi:hypothetical protein